MSREIKRMIAMFKDSMLINRITYQPNFKE